MSVSSFSQLFQPKTSPSFRATFVQCLFFNTVFSVFHLSHSFRCISTLSCFFPHSIHPLPLLFLDGHVTFRHGLMVILAHSVPVSISAFSLLSSFNCFCLVSINLQPPWYHSILHCTRSPHPIQPLPLPRPRLSLLYSTLLCSGRSVGQARLAKAVAMHAAADASNGANDGGTTTNLRQHRERVLASTLRYASPPIT